MIVLIWKQCVMIAYNELETNELLNLIRTCDNGAFSELVNRYTPMLSKIALSFVNQFVLYEEAFSEACVAMHRAALTYDINRSSQITFGLYSQICVQRRLCDLVSRECRGVELVDTDVERLYTKATVEERLIGRERMQQYLETARMLLSEYEYSIFLSYINGENTAAISKKLSKSVKSVENAKSRMLKKLREGSNMFSDL